MRRTGSTWKWIAVSIAVAVVAIAAALLAHRAGPPAAQPAAAAKNEAPAVPAPQPTDAGAAQIPFSPRIHPATPLPAEGSGGPASRAAIDRLKAAAGSGNRQAACQVGIELMRCATGAATVSATTRGPVSSQSDCTAIAQADPQAASRYLAQASAAGSDAARRALAGDLAVRPEDCAP